MFADIKAYITLWIFMVGMTQHTEVNGALQENLAFNYLRGELHPDIAILMDMGDTAKLNGMDQHIAKTVKRWIKYSVPEGEYIGVAQIGASNKMHLPVTIMGDMNQRSGLASKIIPVVHGESNALKGIHIAEEMISRRGSFIFLLSHKKWEEPYIGINEKKILLKLLERNHKIVNIFMSVNASACETIELNSNIQFLHISENSLYVQHEMRVMNIDTALAEVMAVYTSDWGRNNMSTASLLEKETLINQESGAGTNISITVFSCKQFRRLEISMRLLCGSSTCEFRHNLPECNEAQYGTDKELSTSWISYPCSLNGTWTLSILCPTDNEETSIHNFFTKVYEVCIFQENDEKPIEFTCVACKDWKTPNYIENKVNFDKSLCTRGDNHAHWNDFHLQPVLIFSQIEENHNLLENINITVTSEDVGDLMNTYMSSKETIRLHDDGWGADRANNDGIYSGYFYPSENSSNHCLHNSLPCNFSLVCSASGYGPKYGNFQIEIRGPPFQFQKTDETYPPDKIRDLKGEQDGMHPSIKLTWTAPGRSLGSGKVFEYVFQFVEKCHDNSTGEHEEDEDLYNKKNESLHFQLLSLPGEICNFSVPFENNKSILSDSKICFLIEAIGESQKKSKSNCACAPVKLVKATKDSFNIIYIVIILIVLFGLLLLIIAWRKRLIPKVCCNFFPRNSNENGIALEAVSTQPEGQPLSEE